MLLIIILFMSFFLLIIAVSFTRRYTGIIVAVCTCIVLTTSILTVTSPLWVADTVEPVELKIVSLDDQFIRFIDEDGRDTCIKLQDCKVMCENINSPSFIKMKHDLLWSLEPESYILTLQKLN